MYDTHVTAHTPSLMNECDKLEAIMGGFFLPLQRWADDGVIRLYIIVMSVKSDYGK